MAGTVQGGKNAAATNKQRFGDDFYKRIGAMGGGKLHRESRAFYLNRELARTAGATGGKVSKRGKANG